MLIPHLHLGGRCREALAYYEKAFDARAECVFAAEDSTIVHAEMRIHGQRVMLNDRCGSDGSRALGALHLIVTFDSVDALKSCYAHMEAGSALIDPMQATDYSPCTVGFFDPYGVWWGFMVE